MWCECFSNCEPGHKLYIHLHKVSMLASWSGALILIKSFFICSLVLPFFVLNILAECLLCKVLFWNRFEILSTFFVENIAHLVSMILLPTSNLIQSLFFVHLAKQAMKSFGLSIAIYCLNLFPLNNWKQF